MALKNYAVVTLRASAATVGASEQDAAVTLPETAVSVYVVVDKTAENNIDNLLTVRLQCQIASNWHDVAWDWSQKAATLTTAGDNTALVTRTPNILDALSDSLPTVVAYYDALPTRVVRIVSVSSGTGVTHTFSVVAHFRAWR